MPFTELRELRSNKKRRRITKALMSIRRGKKMASRIRHGLLVSIIVIGLLLTLVLTSYSETINYIYDELNRLKRVEYGDGTVIEYIYDKAGNRLEKTLQIPDTTPPTTTALPPGGNYNIAQSVTLSCNDGTGSGCDKTYYTTDGSTPTTSSPVYSSPLNISETITLKFFSRDLAGNSEAVKTEIYMIDTIAPTTTASPGGGFYSSAQSVTLTCNDGSGLGCDKIYYTIDGTTPTTSSPIYSSPINIPVTTVLKFFARDLVGNSETVKTETYTISTNMVTVELKDGTGNPLSGGVVQYYSGGWQVFGTTDASGRVSRELQPGTYTFSMNFAYARQEKSQNIASNPTVVFQTTNVMIQLKDSTGSLMDTGTVQYYSGGWRDIGSTSGGQVSKELLPGSYTFSMNYAYARQEKSQNIATNPTVVFQTTRVTVELRDSTNSLIDTGTVQYYSGGWRDIGSTSGGQVSKELLPLTYTFSMTYGFARQEKSQNMASNPTVVFQTGQVHSDSGSCTHYYAGGWRVFVQDMELLPVTYIFRFNDETLDSSYTIINGTVTHIH
jgi:YD repeat-containing protein